MRSTAGAVARWAACAALAAAVVPCAPAYAQATTPATGPAADGAATVDLTPTERAAAEVKALAEVLEAPTPDPMPRRYTRDEAARRLALRGTGGGDEVLARVITSPNGRDAKLAALRGLLVHPSPPGEWIEPIKNLLSDQVLNKAAADALAAYKDDARALTALGNFAKDAREFQLGRTVAARALGTMPDPQAAAVLVGLLDDPRSTVRAAAAAALVDLSGRRDIGLDAAGWKRWQAQNVQKPAAQWKADVINARAAAQDDLRRRNLDLSNELTARLTAEFNAAQPAQRPAALLDMMRSGLAEVREAGVDLLHKGFLRATLNVADPQLKDRLAELLGDSDPDVRLQAALALYDLNEFAAYDALVAQIPAEPDEGVKAAQLRLLGRLETHANSKRVRSVALMRELLNDPSLIVAKAAADALQQVGPAVAKQQPALAADLAQDLENLVRNTAGKPESAELRVSGINALGALRSKGLIDLAPQLLNDREPPATRRTALRALGELGDPRGADFIAGALGGQERDQSVRLEAMNALGRTAGLEVADLLLRYMDPRQETDPSVRDAARATFLLLLPNATLDQLKRVIGPAFRSDREMHVAILKALAARLEEKGDMESVAVQRESIGVDLIELKKPAEAVPFLEQAVAFYEKQNAQGFVVERLVGELTRAHLQAKQYAQAVAFASRTLARDPAQMQALGSTLKQEADRLRNAGQPDDAIALIDAVLQMNPPLDGRYIAQLKEIRTQAQQAKAAADGAAK